MNISKETFTERFHELSAKTSKIQERLTPLRDELAAIVAGTADLSLSAAKKREATLRAKIRAGQDELIPIEQERAMCSRALGGATGPLREDAAFLAKLD